MKQWAELVKKILEYNPRADQAFLGQLYDFISEILQKNEQKGSYYHALSVVRTLVELRMDTASIAAALLSELVESNLVTLETVREVFGDDVAFLTESLTRILKLSPRTRSEIQAEEFRKMILAMAKDIRVILIRLAFCLQQLRIAVEQELEVSEKLTREVMETYAPIAHRLGIYWIKNELEDLAFRLQDPVAYNTLNETVKLRRQGGEDVVRKVVALLKKRLRKNHIEAEVFGREKHLYSIHTKLLRKNIGIEELYDIIAYRIIVQKKSDCYKVFGMIHSEFSPVPGRFKDYIAMPKSNGYKSLHTVVIGPFGNRIEIQIRTDKMHQVAESGVAAHWTYKGRGGLDTKKRSAATGYAWLKQKLEVHQKTVDPGLFLEHVKIDLFPNEIYVFTPNGDIRTLPQGSTPVDFAYSVHSAVGNHCQGAKVNGRMVPLKTVLETGDRVEIITNKNQTPNSAWLGFVVTGQAKYRINRWEKTRRREQGVMLGRELLTREVQKAGQGLILGNKALARGAAAFNMDTEEEFLYQIGISLISPLQAIHVIFPQTLKSKEEEKEEGGEFAEKMLASVSRSRNASEKKSAKSIRLMGLSPEMAISTARCCNPVPGDSIVGIISTGKGVVLHGIGCPNLTAMANQPERWVEDIFWPATSSQNYRTRLRIMAQNKRDVLPTVSQIITTAQGIIVQIKIQDRDRDPIVMILDIEVEGLGLLQEIISKLKALDIVEAVERIRG
ncbi:MAG: bifunctional (p)ppGpp synthetase/guanosine-3',5'-bis(diphosphate) 3'-pyrophosphohydrolase [Magnetococcales bacterium]|nr:bifunctional (p)ppGpp synthetase/guanosine-3',5'-bis(diphosphate) 3'-pyrophosphohydrolase [Magnetococcales bacterium]